MTHIKICGITNLKDALAAIEYGADMLGFNFYPKSPRYITPAACQNITSILRQQYPHITLVGVFVNTTTAEIQNILQTCHLHLAQLHGDEPPTMLAALQGLAFKAIRLSAQTTPSLADLLSIIQPFLPSTYASDPIGLSAPQTEPASALYPALLIDAAAPGMYGGSGHTTDWSTAAALAMRLPLLLAGGLTPTNVAAAIRQVKPWGVDVASGVEASPGRKDPEKMKQFVEAIHKSIEIRK